MQVKDHGKPYQVNRGAIETAQRAHQNVSQVFRYAIATGRATLDHLLTPTTEIGWFGADGWALPFSFYKIIIFSSVSIAC